MNKSIIQELDGIHQSLLEYVKSKMQGKTWADFDTNELGDIVDMIKDLSEAKYYEACVCVKIGNCDDYSKTNRVEYSLYPEDRELIEASLMRRRQPNNSRYQEDEYALTHGMRDPRYYYDRYPDTNYYDDRSTMRDRQYNGYNDNIPASMRTATSPNADN